MIAAPAAATLPPENDKGRRDMSIGEKYYLALVIVSLCGFAVSLAATSFIERHWAKGHRH
jgi:hypothetical protein